MSIMQKNNNQGCERMTKPERIASEIDVWENALVIYTRALEEAIKYGDYGGQQHNEHMV